MGAELIYWQERLDHALQELLALYELHRDEVYGLHAKGAPDVGAYRALDTAGWLRVYTVRTGTVPRGMLVGYCIMVLRRGMNDELIEAQDAAIFIRKEYRGHGDQFIEWVDQQIAREGCARIFRTTKAAHNYGPLLMRAGYTQHDIVYVKDLSKEPSWQPPSQLPR